MKLFIPKLGTNIRLLAPWSFSLVYEGRNRTLWDLIFSPPDMTRYPTKWKESFCEARLVTLPEGTELSIERMFIRKGSEDYNSVTFRGEVGHLGVLRKVRFWARLDDVNNIYYEVI